MDQTELVLRLGARGSLLSRLQSQQVGDAIEKAHPGVKVELVVIKTTGDEVVDQPLHELGGKGLFTREIDLALLDGRIDFAVHSFKDVPVTMPLVATESIVTAAVPKREDPRDVLVSRIATTLAQLPQGARVGTGSLRRRAQLLAIRPDLRIIPIRGNVDTRIKKMQGGDVDAVILAMAGLKRSGLFDSAEMNVLDCTRMLPDAGQGALSIQCRADDPNTRDLLEILNDSDSAACVEAERQVVRNLNGDCRSPIGSLARIESGELLLHAAVGRHGGEPPVLRAEARGRNTVEQVIEQLERQGVRADLGQVS